MNASAQPADAFETKVSRYIVGIDLGTTNSAVAFVDTHDGSSNDPHTYRVQTFAVPQWVDFTSREAREVLPSFHYEPTESESQAMSSIAGTKVHHVVGTLAREAGARQPGRHISSAKSWLCHDGVDRQAPLLPWHSDTGVTKLSPVETSARVLEHIRQEWDKRFTESPLAEQDVVLTLPASFDEVARQLTIEAARMAGLPRILLIEEPQAAFYWWLHRHSQQWEDVVSVGQTILVCDIGGGTTDFTLIRARAVNHSSLSNAAATETLHEQDRRRLSLHRVAVGDHLILGGDNIDLALARYIESLSSRSQPLSARSWDLLRGVARSAKEQLLGPNPPSTYSVSIASGGSRLIAGQTRVELKTDDVQRELLDGFFPRVSLSDRPTEHSSGFQEFGLPYATDAAVTRHLASFLWDHRRAGRDDTEANLSDLQSARPDWVLFNGGVLASSQIRERLVDVIGQWFAGTDDRLPADWKPGVLQNDRLDLAVACGAAYFGLVRRGVGVRIEAKLARSYYLLVSEQPPQALCIVGGNASPGDKYRMESTPLELAIGEPVQFPVLYSSTRLADAPGQIVDVTPEHFNHLAPLRTVVQLPQRKNQVTTIQVVLETELSEFGTLQLWCSSARDSQRWQLEFDIRSTTETDRDTVASLGTHAGVVEESLRAKAKEILELAFGNNAAAQCPDVMKQLATVWEMPKHQWPPALLRGLWQDLIELSEGRRRSANAEARWLNLVGYALRPGYGMAADDWRVTQTWRTVYGKLAFSTASSRNQALILWRRVAGGFTAGQQLAVYQQVASPLRNALDPLKRSKGGMNLETAELIELLRLVGSLELLPVDEKHQLGQWLLDVVDNKRWAPARDAILWTIGRLGNRIPIYGPLNTVVHLNVVEQWLESLLRHSQRGAAWQLSIMLCARRAGDRYRDIDSSLRNSILSSLASAPEHYRRLVESGGQLAQAETSEILGESLPLGLRISATEQ